MKLLVLCVSITLAYLSLIPAQAATASQPKLQVSVKAAIYADGRLWLLGDTNALFSLAEDDKYERPEPGAGEAAGLCLSDGHATIITKPTAKSKTWEIRQFVNQGWQTRYRMDFEAPDISVFGCNKDHIVVIGQRLPFGTELDIIKNGEVIETLLNGELHPGDTSTYLAGDWLYVGIDAGEWGGGLQRVSLTTGLLDSIDALSSMNACNGPLYSGCDPVNAIDALPGQPECISVAVGLAHMGLRKGRVLSVCDRKVEKLYDQVLSRDPSLNDLENAAINSVPFRSIAVAGTKLVASGDNGLYQIDPGARTAQPLQMPKFARYGPFTVSFSIPGIIVIESDPYADRATGENVILVLERQ